jgi:hypothetical protein
LQTQFRTQQAEDFAWRQHSPGAALSLFLVSARLPKVEAFRSALEQFGFSVLESFDLRSLPASDKSRLLYLGHRSVSDHGWQVFAAADFSPRPRDWHPSGPTVLPFVDNGRLNEVREMWAYFGTLLQQSGETPPKEQDIFWTPTSNVARALLAEWQPEITDHLVRVIRTGVLSMAPRFPVIRELATRGFARDARTYVVRYKGRPAFFKVYRPGRERLLKNNLLVLKRLGHVPEITTAIEWGSNWLVTPYVDNATTLREVARRAGLIPLPLIRSLASVVYKIHDAGLAHLDFCAWHVLVDSSGRLHVIDFDRIHVYEGEKPPIQQNVMLSGYDRDIDFDGPVKRWSYSEAWAPFTGLPLYVFLNPVGYRVFGFRFCSRVLKTTRRIARLGKSARRRLGRLVLG